MGTQINMHVVSNNSQHTLPPTKQRITMADASQKRTLSDQFRIITDGTNRMLVYLTYKANSLTFGLTERIGLKWFFIAALGFIVIMAWRSKTVTESGKITEANLVTESGDDDQWDWHSIIGGSGQTSTRKNKTDGRSNSLAPASVSELNEQMILAYVERYHKVAVGEMDQFGIPASISLAQGLIESRSGTSILARKNNNHFGMKCFSKKCANGHCSNHTDDHHKDFFRIYKSSWESWRAHSHMLRSGRYSVLQKYGKDYRRWAKGLRDLGYATDKSYDQKLIGIIEKFKLNKFDEL